MIANQLRQLLQEHNLTLEQLSERSDVPLETLRNILYKKSLDPRIFTVSSICDALNVSVDALLNKKTADAEQQLLNLYRSCSTHGKYHIRMISEMEAALTRSCHIKREQKKLTVPCFYPLMDITENAPYEIYPFHKLSVPTSDAAFAVCMPNQNYAPSYYQKDILLFSNTIPQHGNHALFLIHNRLYFRRVISSRQGFILRSIGKKYPPIHIKHMHDCTVLGTCIGIIR